MPTHEAITLKGGVQFQQPSENIQKGGDPFVYKGKGKKCTKE
jgi:hypothetical protein